MNQMGQAMLSLLEDLLISKGLVSEEEMVRAFEYQRANEGLISLSGALTATGAITAAQIKEVMDETPEAPITIEDIDVNPMLLLQLMIKGIHTENLETASQISEAMKLPNSVVNELLEDAVVRKFIEVVGKESAGGDYAGIRYQLSQAGRDWALESLEQSQYFTNNSSYLAVKIDDSFVVNIASRITIFFNQCLA